MPSQSSSDYPTQTGATKGASLSLVIELLRLFLAWELTSQRETPAECSRIAYYPFTTIDALGIDTESTATGLLLRFRPLIIPDFWPCRCSNLWRSPKSLPHLCLPICLPVDFMRTPLPRGNTQTPSDIFHKMVFLSQDKDETFSTFLYVNEDYGKPYKNIEDLKEKKFSTMREYGPFRLGFKEHMNHIAGFLHTGSSKTRFRQAERHSCVSRKE